MKFLFSSPSASFLLFFPSSSSSFSLCLSLLLPPTFRGKRKRSYSNIIRGRIFLKYGTIEKVEINTPVTAVQNMINISIAFPKP